MKEPQNRSSCWFSGNDQHIRTCICEMKISPAISIRNATAISDFWPPNVNEGSQTAIQLMLPPSTLIAEELGECKKQPSATP